jgi:2',3'-cyclic-nucleotide 2'-phosphodiesterase (5'-nucleotidase family)
MKKSVSSNSPKIILLYVSDYHTHLLPGKNGLGGLARLAQLIENEKKEAGSNGDVVVISGGDVVEKGSLPCRASQDIACTQLFKDAGVQYSALGNNELYRGADALKKLVSESGIIWVNANVKTAENNQNWQNQIYFKGPKSGLNFWMFSWTRNPFWEAAALQKTKLKITNDISATQWNQWASTSKKDSIIWLLHWPWSEDKTFSQKACQKFSEQNAVFLSGDDHQLKNTGEFCAPLWNSSAFLEDVIKVVLTPKPNSSLLQAASVESIALDKNIAENSAIKNKIDELYSKFAPTARDKVAEIEREMPPEELAHWIAKSLLYVSKADVAIVNSGLVKNGLTSGEVTQEDLQLAAPYSNDIMGLDWSKENLEKSLCEATKREKEAVLDMGSDIIIEGAQLKNPGTNNCSLELPNRKKALKVVVDSYMVSRSKRWLGKDISGVSFRFGFKTEKAMELMLKKGKGLL